MFFNFIQSKGYINTPRDPTAITIPQTTFHQKKHYILRKEERTCPSICWLKQFNVWSPLTPLKIENTLGSYITVCQYLLKNLATFSRSSLVFCQSTTTLFPFWFILTSLVFVFSNKLLFKGLLLYKGHLIFIIENIVT